MTLEEIRLKAEDIVCNRLYGQPHSKPDASKYWRDQDIKMIESVLIKVHNEALQSLVNKLKPENEFIASEFRKISGKRVSEAYLALVAMVEYLKLTPSTPKDGKE